jgi:anti-sigma B factor antagonist
MSRLAHLDVREDGGVLFTRLSGEIDLSNSSDLEQAIVSAVPNTALGMVLDLTDVTYIDSAGILLLLDLASRFQWRGQHLGLVAPEDSRVRRVLTLAGAESVVVVDSTAAAARSRMGLPPPGL